MKKVRNILIMMIFLIPCLLTGAYAYDEITTGDAYDMATTNPNAYILDVRTEAEWRYVGHPGENSDGEGALLKGKVANISYMIWEKGVFVVNPHFISDVEEVFGDKENIVLIVMCRSGVRSIAASIALESSDYLNVYNMTRGFEGGKDSAGYRTVDGWVIDGHPYTYSGAGYLD